VCEGQPCGIIGGSGEIDQGVGVELWLKKQKIRGRSWLPIGRPTTIILSKKSSRPELCSSYADVKEGEVFLHHCHISPYSHGNMMNHDPIRTRKLLLHRKEINKLLGKTQQKGLTLIPLRIYFSERGQVKVELGLAKGKKQHDRRESIKAREAGREVERAIKERK
jgi:SsrA-binding protein